MPQSLSLKAKATPKDGQRHPLILLTGVGAAVKILVEINAGQAPLTRTAWPSVPTVHAAGFLCGLVLGWGIWVSDRIQY